MLPAMANYVPRLSCDHNLICGKLVERLAIFSILIVLLAEFWGRGEAGEFGGEAPTPR